jgi:hypothetical protein
MRKARITPVRSTPHAPPFPCHPSLAEGWAVDGAVYVCQEKAQRAAKLAADARRRTLH